MVRDVVGREQELAAVGAFLDRVEGGPHALVLSGEPGIGKTVLWETCVASSAQRGHRVLAHRGAEAEAAFSFAGLSDLLGPLFDDLAPSLAAPRRRALGVALFLEEPGDAGADAHAIGLAVLDALRALADGGAVVVALDDVQWLDSASAGVLEVAFRRLRDERVGMLVTLRSGTGPPLELERMLPEGQLEHRPLGPLTAVGVHSLLKDRLGLELTRPELARLYASTSGNPFFALELGRELLVTGTRPTAGRVPRVPKSLGDVLGARLARLSAETLDVLVHVAALARPTAELVAASYGNRDRVLTSLEVALRERVVELDDTRLRFVHPLLASVCYEQTPVWKRHAVHRALARAVADPEERARHLALAADGPDTDAACQLESAAERAAARGATSAAAELSELAAELTGDDAELGRRRLLLAARFHRLAGSSDGAIGLLDELLPEATPGGERADVLFELALNYLAGAPAAIAFCNDALAEAGADAVRATAILSLRSLYQILGSDIPAAVSDARAALAGAERTAEPQQIATAIARLGHAEQYAAEITPGLLERGVEIERQLDAGLQALDSPRFFLVRQRLLAGETDYARAGFSELEAEAAARGDEFSRMLALWHVSWAEWGAGRLPAALAAADGAQEVGGQMDIWHERAWVGRIRALVEADLGLLDEARMSAGQAVGLAEELALFTLLSRSTLGRIELASGDLESAGVHLRDLPGQLLAAGVVDPALPHWADVFETLIGLGELESARTYIEAHERRAQAIGSPWAAAVGARARGLLAAGERDFGTALAALDVSLRHLDGLQLPLERARTLLCLGIVRRQAQQKRASREALDLALAMFEELGAPMWAEKTRAESRRISGRRSAADGLTQTEVRVASLAARGRSNKEIAAELFMGVSTVEMHLSRVYRKLEIRSRSGLAARLSMTRDREAQS